MAKHIVIAEEKLDKLIKKIVLEVKEEITREIFKDITDILKDILKTLRELAEAQKRTEKRLDELTMRVNQLAEAQRRTEERLDELTMRVNQLAEAQRRTEERLNELAKEMKKLAGEVATLRSEVSSLRGDMARLEGSFIEFKVIHDLGGFLRDYGFRIYSAPYDLMMVDAIIESDDFVAIMEICKKCDLYDLRQILEGAKKFEEIEGRAPDVLILFSYTGVVEKDVLKEADKHSVIVENSVKRLAKKLLSLRRK